MIGHWGFTLFEVVLVLIVLSLGTALVAPALAPPEEAPTTLSVTLTYAKHVALRRGEIVSLSVSEDGTWALSGEGVPSERVIASGTLDAPALGDAFNLRVSPFGSCGPAPGSEAVAQRIDLDLLTCSVLP